MISVLWKRRLDLGDLEVCVTAGAAFYKTRLTGPLCLTALDFEPPADGRPWTYRRREMFAFVDCFEDSYREKA